MSETAFGPDSIQASVEVVKVLAGKAFGLRQPTYLARCRFDGLGHIDWRAIDDLADQVFLKEFGPVSRTELGFDTPLIDRVGSWATAIQSSAGLPVFEPPCVLARNHRGHGVSVLLAVPYAPDRSRAAIASLRWASRSAALLLEDAPSSLAGRCEIVAGWTEELFNMLRSGRPKNRNSLHFLKAAHDRGTPWDLVTGNIYQFGWGTKARLMDGAFTDESGTIGARVARNKHATAELLRRIGLPAPEHSLVKSPEDAEEAAERLGYPIVVKPADLDRGLGVATNLRTPQEVRSAYLAAAKLSKRILIEKHFFGQDYRLAVFRGELLWSVLRQPGGVTGDGRHTIRQLAEIANSDPSRGESPRAPLKRLKLDDEAHALLSEVGLSVDSVPLPDQFVRLRRAANVAGGGTPSAVNDRIHPDNRQLALDVAEAVRLDLVGIDLLIEDISGSWRETGAVVCEVNGDPQLGIFTQQHLYGEIIGTLCDGVGRIPIIVLIGSDRARGIAALIIDELSARGRKAGVASTAEVRIDGRSIMGKPTDIFVASQMLIANRCIEVALVVIEDESVLNTSLPFDRIDALLLVDALERSSDALSRLVRMIAPNSHDVIVSEDLAPLGAAVAQVPQRKLRFVPGRDQTLAVAAIDAVEKRCQGAPAFE